MNIYSKCRFSGSAAKDSDSSRLRMSLGMDTNQAHLTVFIQEAPGEQLAKYRIGFFITNPKCPLLLIKVIFIYLDL